MSKDEDGVAGSGGWDTSTKTPPSISSSSSRSSSIASAAFRSCTQLRLITEEEREVAVDVTDLHEQAAHQLLEKLFLRSIYDYCSHRTGGSA